MARSGLGKDRAGAGLFSEPLVGGRCLAGRFKETAVNLTYQVWRRHALFVNGRNILNHHDNLLRYTPETPDYAKRSSTNSYGDGAGAPPPRNQNRDGAGAPPPRRPNPDGAGAPPPRNR
jgi:hypothetical protein